MIRLTNFSFQIKDGWAWIVEYQGHKWDMHNYSDFIGLTHDVLHRSITMSWIVTGYDFAPVRDCLADRIDIRFDEVDYLEITPRDPEMPFNEDMTFVSVSYLKPDDDVRDLLNGSTMLYRPDENTKDEYHLLFRFHGGPMFRINAESAVLILHNLKQTEDQDVS